MNKKVLHSVFEDVAGRRPAAIAIETGEATISYAELNAFANRLAHLSIQPGHKAARIVNVVIPSSIELVAAMLSVFKSGGIFLPVDLAFSEKRLRQVFTETFDGAVITTDDNLEQVTALAAKLDISIPYLVVINPRQNIRLFEYKEGVLHALVFEETDAWRMNPGLTVEGNHSNYIYYTSGSTGEGKAIEGMHASLSHFIHWEIGEFGIDENFRISQLTQVTFDASLRDIFTALISGGTLCIPGADIRNNPSRLIGWLVQSEIMLVHCVPSLLRILTKELKMANASKPFNRLQYILLAGELIYAKDIMEWRKYAGDDIQLVNLYGATETTLIKAFYRIGQVAENPNQAIPVGKPISNTTIAIIKDGRMTAPGQIGEIYIKTPFTTKGYYKNEKLSAECFVQNPLVKDVQDIVYKTGDLGRFLPDGNMEVLGRLDSQVKVNGIRVELGEIERVMIDIENITGVVVKTHKTDDNLISLAAYYTGKKMEPAYLRTALEKQLNPQVIPSYFIYLDHFPLNINGKIDKKALPVPTEILMGGQEMEMPSTDLEIRLAQFWKDILGLEKIGRNTSFFNIGGHSLRAIQLVSRVHKELGVQLKIGDIFTHKTIGEQAAFIAQNLDAGYSGIMPVDKQPDYALSSAQRRLWVMSGLEEVNIAYNMPGSYEFEGPLDLEALEYSFLELIKRHEILRTVFLVNDHGEVRQYVRDVEKMHFSIGRRDLRPLDENYRQQEINQLLQQDFAAPFDLEHGPLLRVNLYRVSDQRWILSYVMHHIISDGWSMGILLKELLSLYQAKANGVALMMPPLRIQYKDYAAWQQEQLRKQEAAKRYWLDELSGELPVLELPADRARPLVKTYRGGVVSHELDRELVKNFKTLCEQNGCTLYMGLVSLVNILLYRYSGAKDIIIGSPIAGREHADLENQIGLYLNTLAIRTRIKEEERFADLLDRTAKKILDAYKHQAYPFDELVGELNLQRDMSRSALFDVLIDYHDRAALMNVAGNRSELSAKSYAAPGSRVSKFDLTFMFVGWGDELRLSLEYSSDLFDAARIERMQEHFSELLHAVLSSNEPVQRLKYISDKERTALLQMGSNEKNYAYRSVVDLFEEQCRLHPEAIALRYSGQAMSYKELKQRSDALAATLQNTYSIQRGALIGVMMERSEDMIIALLGILKSGAAYVPIDPDYPADRRRRIIEETGMKLLLTQLRYMLEFSWFEGELYTMDGAPDNESTITTLEPSYAGDLAYVLYTSGSTGTPKGCCITHGNLSSYIQWANDYYFKESTQGNFGLYTSLSFDLTVTSIFTTLTRGRQLKIFEQQMEVQEILARSFRGEEGIDSIKLTPSHIKFLGETGQLSTTMHCAIVGGEELREQQVEQLKLICPSIHIYNEYGPTEATVGCVVTEVEPGKKILIGRPIAGTSIYILDDNQELCATGIDGELCIAGAGLSKGYLNNEQQTRERFIQNPFKQGELIYRTGDRARWLATGEVEYLGRTDDQLKIRGYRVEPAEIEAVLKTHDKIQDAVVLGTKDPATGETELTAFIVVSEEQEIQATELRQHMKGRLSAWMIPQQFVQVETIPINNHGKTDRGKLLELTGRRLKNEQGYMAPRTEIESGLVKIWEEVLGCRDIGIKDNFFELGGHSLRATRLVSLIHKTFEVNIGLKDIFANAVLEEQAQLIGQSRRKTFQSIEPVPASANGYRLSSSQYRLWVLSQFEEGNVAYNIPVAHLFEGNLDQAALQYAFNELISRHEILRTVFRENEEGEVRQFVLSPEECGFQIAYYDLRKEIDKDAQARELVRSAFMKPFDLGKGPLISASLIAVEEKKWVFTCVMHHIISDGWSKNILINDLLLLCNSRLRHLPYPLNPLRIQYKDYANWEQEQLSAEALQEHKSYWLKQFEGELPVLDLPIDRPRPLVKTFNGGAIRKNINSRITAGIHSLCVEQGATLFMGVLAAVNTLLYRYTNQEDMIVGSLVAGRDHADLEGQIGYYLKTLALRTRFSGSDSYRQLLEKVRHAALGAYEHQVYPFEELVNDLKLQRDMSRHPLIDVMVVLQNTESQSSVGDAHPDEMQIGGYAEREYIASKFDLLFDFVETGNGLQLRLEYNSDIFNAATVARFAQHLVALMESITNMPGEPLCQLPWLDQAEKHQLLVEFNNTPGNYPAGSNIIHQFKEQVRRTPEATAIVFENDTITYSELDLRAQQLANHLEELGVQEETLVPLFIDRSPEMIIAIMAIWKAGGAYVPIDTAYPPERIRFIMQDCRASIIVSNTRLKQLLPQANDIQIVEADTVSKMGEPAKQTATYPKPHQLAYVIYTSGSTGNPKGVMVEHDGMLNHLYAKINELGITQQSVLAYTAAYTFDISVWQMFAALLCGGRTIIYPDAIIYEPAAIVSAINNDNITILELVPAYLSIILNEVRNLSFDRLSYLLVTGEAVSKNLLVQWFTNKNLAGIPVVNAYGPTEASDDVCHHIMHELPAGNKVPIGKPIQNTRIYILNPAMQLCPPGVTGEICIAGTGVSRGYLNLDSLTNEKFVPDPFAGTGRIYKTGDLGRWLPDGTIEFLGRLDSQVKLRGYRIELEEIENVMLESELVSQAVASVVTVPSGEKYLLAFIVPTARFKKELLLAYLRTKLPEYMVPAHLVNMEKIPLTANGKIDRNALPVPALDSSALAAEYCPPRNETERKLAAIWQEVLGKERIGIRDNFFESGGHSLKAIQLIARINRDFRVRITIQTIFRENTIENLSEQINFILDQGKQRQNKKQLMEIEL